MATTAATEAFQEALLDDDPVALYDRAPCGYVSTTPDGTIVKVNTTFLTWTGYTVADLVGRKKLVDVLPPGVRLYFETHVRPMLHTGAQVKEIALDLLLADGDRMHVLANGVMERSPDGEPQISRFAFFDATERRRYELELLEAKKRAEASEARAVHLAETLQQTLIPPTPHVPGLEVASAYRPAGRGDEVGGDFYDVFQVGDDEWVLALGDVSGKGAEAAVVTALVRHSIRALAIVERSPQALLEKLNDILMESDTDRFCTVVVAFLSKKGDDWDVVTSSGGHPMPFVLRPTQPPEPFGKSGTFVGAFDEVHFSEAEMTLHPGESIFFHTDGVTEARQGREFFGDSRLVEALAEPDAPWVVVQRVLDRVLDFQGQLPKDDIELLAVRVPA